MLPFAGARVSITAVSGVQYFGRERASTNYFLFLTHEHFLFRARARETGTRCDRVRSCEVGFTLAMQVFENTVRSPSRRRARLGPSWHCACLV